MGYLLGIDIGTSFLKSVLIEEEGNEVFTDSKSYNFSTPKKGYVDHDPEEWWEACKDTIASIFKHVRIDKSEIRGISFAGQMHGLVALDKNHQVIRPAILHNDARSSNQVEEIKRILGIRRIKELVGNPIYTGFLLPSLLWIRENEPANYEKIRYVMLPKDYIKFKLTGEISSDFSDASATLLFDIRNSRWSEEILTRMDIDREILPQCYETSQAIGIVSRTAALDTGLAAGTVVVAGGGDQVMQCIGNGAIEIGDACVNIGTSGQVSFQCDKPVMNPSLNTNTFCGYKAGQWFTMGAIMSAGMSYKWFNNLFERYDYDALNEKIAGIKPGSGGLLFLPYLNGERTPHLNPNISGAFVGLNINTSREEMSRAVMEGVTYALNQCIEVCRDLGLTKDILIASGGAARSRPWLQIQADVFNLPVKISRTREQAGLGAAIAAGHGAGTYRNIAEGCARHVKFEEEIIEPNAANHEVYREYYHLFKDMYQESRTVIEKITLLGRQG